MDLFDYTDNIKKTAPLADRMRPLDLNEVLGQKHILSKGSLLFRAIEADMLGSCIFFGPAGTGKSTLAALIAKKTGGLSIKLNAVSSGVADAKAAIEEGRKNKSMFKKRTYLILDECHRWSKAQSDSVLAAIEEGLIILLGTTTENPYAALTPAIVSRCRIFQLQPLSDADIIEGLKRASKDTERGLGSLNVDLTDDAKAQFAYSASGDMRNALNGLELAVLTTPAGSNGRIIIDKKVASESMQSKTISMDQSLYYDMLSALCKSLRGSNPSASLYWGMRLIESGCDPLVVARRVVAHASEDVGMADSNALLMAVAAFDSIKNLGIPEGRLALSHAIIYVANAHKSNAVCVAMGEAIKDAQSTANNNVPSYLRDRNYKTPDDDGTPYKYPHDYPDGKVKQEYMPKELRGRDYFRK